MKYLVGVCLFFMLAGCTETFKRNLKSVQSEYLGGLNRVCTVYSMTGSVIKEYRGKLDLKPSEKQLLFDLGGKRSIIRNATVICDEI